MLPQIIVLCLLAMSLGISLVKDGEPKNENYSVWTSLLSAVILLGLLFWGGFFGVLFN